MGPGFGMPFGQMRKRKKFSAFDQSLSLPGDESRLPLATTPGFERLGEGLKLPASDRLFPRLRLAPDPAPTPDPAPAPQPGDQPLDLPPTGPRFTQWQPMGGGSQQGTLVSNAAAPPAAAPGFDFMGEWKKIGAPPKRAEVQRRERKFGDIIPNIFSGLGDVFAAKGGQRGGHLASNVQVQEGFRDQDFRDRAGQADRTFADDTAGYQHQLAGLNMRQRIADSLKADQWRERMDTRDTKYKDAYLKLKQEDAAETKRLNDVMLKQSEGQGGTNDTVLMDKLNNEGFLASGKTAQEWASERLSTILGSDASPLEKDRQMESVKRVATAGALTGPDFLRSKKEAAFSPPPPGELHNSKLLMERLQKALKGKGPFTPEQLSEIREKLALDMERETGFGDQYFAPSLMEVLAEGALFKPIKSAEYRRGSGVLHR